MGVGSMGNGCGQREQWVWGVWAAMGVGGEHGQSIGVGSVGNECGKCGRWVWEVWAMGVGSMGG